MDTPKEPVEFSLPPRDEQAKVEGALSLLEEIPEAQRSRGIAKAIRTLQNVCKTRGYV